MPFPPRTHVHSLCSLSLQGTILPRVTRKSVLELARDLGFTAEEAPITIEEAMQADEVFTTGTAVVLSPVGSLTYKGNKKVFGKPGAGGEQHVCARRRLLGPYLKPKDALQADSVRACSQPVTRSLADLRSPVEAVVH